MGDGLGGGGGPRQAPHGPPGGHESLEDGPSHEAASTRDEYPAHYAEARRRVTLFSRRWMRRTMLERCFTSTAQAMTPASVTYVQS